MNLSRKLSIFLIIISLYGCASTREEHGSILMEDVVVERTTLRSTKQNPSQNKGSAVNIQGDNINIGTLIVNSPGARVDNSTRITQIQQTSHYDKTSSSFTSQLEYVEDSGLKGPVSKRSPEYHNDRDYLKNISRNIDTIIIRLIPSFIMMRN